MASHPEFEKMPADLSQWQVLIEQIYLDFFPRYSPAIPNV
jgi:hypothetical protein